MRSLHEAEPRLRTPEIRRDFLDRDPAAGHHPRHWQDFYTQHQQMLVQCTVMLDVPDHDRRRITLGPRQEHGGAGNTRNAFGLNILHELRNWYQRFMHSSHHGRRSAMPDPHYAVDGGSQDEGHISAFGDLGEIGEEEGAI